MHAREKSASQVLPFLLAVASCTNVAGPGGDPGGGAPGKADDDTAGGATLTFAEDYVESVSGTVSAGQAVRVRYDADRLPDCRGDLPGGTPAWTITGHATVDGGEETLVALAPGRSDDATALDGLLDALPVGSDLSMYFTVSNRWGCIAYDSDFGANYHFAIAGASPSHEVELEFTADDAVLWGPIHAGDELRVRYDLDRLPVCRGTTRGYPAWGISGYWSVDGGAEHAFDVSRVEGDDRVAEEAILTVPAGSELAFWFAVTNRWGCHAWDSNYGSNWTFPIEPR